MALTQISRKTGNPCEKSSECSTKRGKKKAVSFETNDSKVSHGETESSAEENSSEATSSYSSSPVATGRCFHAGQVFLKYQEDQFPADFDEDKVKHWKRKYTSIPEEFYTKSKISMVTLGNFWQWFKDVQNQTPSKKDTWDFWEFCSGSGRLSLVTWQNGLVTGFPVDRRYGWNLNLAEHRKMLDAARDFFAQR